MRELTKDILDLNLLTPLSIEESTSSHWEDADHITLLETEQARLVLRIEDLSEAAVTHTAYLEIDVFSAHGEVFMTDTMWSANGDKSEVISEFQNETWDEERLRAYSKLLA